jgi:hypothetical protein
MLVALQKPAADWLLLAAHLVCFQLAMFLPEYPLVHLDSCFDYIDARKNIYIPIYKNCASKTEAYKKLKQLHKDNVDIILWDFDGRYTDQTLDEILNDPSKPCGHGFVLKMMLEDFI